jgi:hypothetical protein
MDLGVSPTKIIVSVLGLSEIGLGSSILGHDPSAFSLAYLICFVHLLALLLVVSQSF